MVHIKKKNFFLESLSIRRKPGLNVEMKCGEETLGQQMMEKTLHGRIRTRITM